VLSQFSAMAASAPVALARETALWSQFLAVAALAKAALTVALAAEVEESEALVSRVFVLAEESVARATELTQCSTISALTPFQAAWVA
jgi:hypothetical protein